MIVSGQRGPKKAFSAILKESPGYLARDLKGQLFVLIYDVDPTIGVGSKVALYDNGVIESPAPQFQEEYKNVDKRVVKFKAVTDGLEWSKNHTLLYISIYKYDSIESIEKPLFSFWYNMTTLSIISYQPRIEDIVC